MSASTSTYNAGEDSPKAEGDASPSLLNVPECLKTKYFNKDKKDIASSGAATHTCQASQVNFPSLGYPNDFVDTSFPDLKRL